MGTTWKKCGSDVRSLANEVLVKYPEHRPLLDARVTFDLVFAFAGTDEAGDKTGHALTKHGRRAYGIARKTSLKDRALGRADCEVALDGDWWAEAKAAEQRALLDHELMHFCVGFEDDGKTPVKDACGRPVVELRPHDHEFGWFTAVAARHGEHSIERQQARQIMQASAQMLWPEILEPAAAAYGGEDETKVTISAGGEAVETTLAGLKNMTAKMKARQQ